MYQVPFRPCTPPRQFSIEDSLCAKEIVDQDGKSSLLSPVKAFDSVVLAIYEGFCNLKQGSDLFYAYNIELYGSLSHKSSMLL
ncbi:hypothetical protein L3X38_001882 [Prunus dulcis]|uniref:Uncharacterized protein n=1 Tax=Prunus dulcis TaxID=3755 RepID=A0AAD4WSV4_PRUDU|nr:hypothetical protein L3X38_001882 [Prunus dulcis]